MNGLLKLDKGVVSATVETHAHMDAAVVANSDLAAFEVAIENANVTIGETDSYRAPLTLSVTTDPNTMRALGLLLLSKTNTAAFTVSEWRDIAEALCTSGYAEGEETDEGRALLAYAKRIEEAYSNG